MSSPLMDTLSDTWEEKDNESAHMMQSWYIEYAPLISPVEIPQDTIFPDADQLHFNLPSKNPELIRPNPVDD